MASGDSVVVFGRDSLPSTLFAPIISRVDTSSPASTIHVWAFDAATIEYVDFQCGLEGYAGGGLTFQVLSMAATATTGVIRWGIGIRRFNVGVENYAASHTYDYNDANVTTNGTNGILSSVTIPFTDGADMDSWATGEVAIVRIRRNASHANDTMAGDAHLWGIIGRET